MISILLPVYNYNVTELVRTLHGQLMSVVPNGEIIIFDDGSDIPFKKQYQTLQNQQVKVHQAIKNVGRSKARNQLKDLALYENLLFMDCDASIPSPKFIEKYYQQVKNGYHVVCGGRIYPEVVPSGEFYFHWLYGTHRESQSADVRRKIPHKSFMTNNFLIKKEIFSDIIFDESITTYGHEDTLFGYELFKNSYPITHIENPVVHEGLEKNVTFLEKSATAIRNLHIITKKIDDMEFLRSIKVFHAFQIIKKFHVHTLYRLIFNFSRTLIRRNLLSQNPSLMLFNLYKLGIFCEHSFFNKNKLR